MTFVSPPPKRVKIIGYNRDVKVPLPPFVIRELGCGLTVTRRDSLPADVIEEGWMHVPTCGAEAKNDLRIMTSYAVSLTSVEIVF